MKVIAATKNKGKITEIQKILGDLDFQIISQADAGINVDIEETGKTFAENALLKARAVALLCDEPVIADDSGLCVDALGGRPGVYSARYAGEDATDQERMEKLLAELDGQENRAARFVSVVAMILPDGEEITAEGIVEGHITEEPVGEGGFGYDPIFFCDELGKTFGEAHLAEKNKISHRGRALQALYQKIANRIGEE